MSRTGPILSVLYLEAGGCGGCALEWAAVAAARRALSETGLAVVASPRHADLLLVGGCVTKAMAQAVEAAWTAMPEPRRLVAIGACAIDGGPFRDGYAVTGGIDARLPVALAIPGCPPSPDAILDGLRQLLEPEPQPQPVPGPAPDPVTPSAALLPSRLPAAPRHPPSDGDGSAG